MGVVGLLVWSVHGPAGPATSCVTVDSSLVLSDPQSPHHYSGGDNSACSTGLLREPNEASDNQTTSVREGLEPCVRVPGKG